MAEAIQAKDKEAQEELRKFKAEIDQKMRRDEKDRRRLQQNWDDLRAQKEKELADERKQHYHSMVESNERILKQQHELELKKQEHAHAAEMQMAALATEQWKAEAARRQNECVVM
jgi:putative cell wall-binding protein